MGDQLLAAGVVEETVRAFFQGLPVGAGFALVAMSFVLTYKTSGVFNLAFGAQAFISAATYYELHVRRDWPIWAAVLVAVVLVAPLLGLLLERLIFRHVHAASAVAKLVISLGLLVALPELFKLVVNYDREPPYGAVGIMPDGDSAVFWLSGRSVSRDEIAAFAIMVVAAVALAALFRYTRMGLRIRAVVQSPRMTELNGINSDWVSSGSWMLSSLFAGLAGVLLVPITSTLGTALEPGGYFPIVISALAAAALGRLVSLPAALFGGLLLGVITTELRTHLPHDNVILNELRGSALPYVMLFAIIVFWPAIRRQVAGVDPLLGVAPPPPALAATARSRGLTIYTRIMALAFFTVVGIWTFGYANNFWISRITHSVIFTIIFLSIVVFTGLGGQIALCQVTFAAIGGFGVMQLAQRWDISVMVGMLVGAAIAAAVGAALSVPVMRLGGIWLAIATLSFALFFDDVLVKYGWVGGSISQGRGVPRPQLLGIDFTSHKNFLVLCIAVLVLVSVLVILIRESSTGMALRALRGSETAAESIGVIAWRSRVIVFSISAAIAAIGGGLLAMEERLVSYDATYDPQLGLFWLVIVVVLGARTVEGAAQAGVAFIIFPVLVLERWLHLDGAWRFVLFGFAAITFARHPEGLLEHGKRRSQILMQRIFAGGGPNIAEKQT
ncbi:ABC transporter permease [Candidatus Poriferisocius sp.]|uniref:ABC transporter permease n=1 Tax=Candidatus Poriferisocius sp. TaxID=3101276 RepID=UPI003B02450E